jgi:pyruvate dehydrogenase E1 component alpha subunit
VKDLILKKKYSTQEELSKIDDKIKNKVKECEKFAEESDYPDLSLMYDAVYEQNDYPFLTHKL